MMVEKHKRLEDVHALNTKAAITTVARGKAQPVNNRVDTSLKHASNPQASPRDTRFRHPVAEGGGKQHALLVGE